MGGNPDKSGYVSAEKLVQIIKDYELTIDIEVRMRFEPASLSDLL